LISLRGSCLFLDVDYKTAPEYSFPYAFEECCDLVSFLLNNFDKYGGVKDKIVLMGQSAGSNLVIGIAIKLHEGKKKLPVGFICCYPPCEFITDPAEKTGGIKDPKMIEVVCFGTACYLPNGHNRDIYVSPLFASIDLITNLPPFTMITASNDILCNEALEFSRHLIDAGVTVTIKNVLGANHGFIPRRSEGHKIAEDIIFSSLNNFWEGNI
jgi:acetyl esterase